MDVMETTHEMMVMMAMMMSRGRLVPGVKSPFKSAAGGALDTEKHSGLCSLFSLFSLCLLILLVPI